MLRVALTGGIAAGKSIVAAVLVRRGCALYESDPRARALMEPGGPAYAPLVARFGPAILGPDKRIDRGRLAGLVFGRPADRRAVEAIVHPLVAADRRSEIARLEREGRTRIFVAEAALTIEAGLAAEFDKIVVVWCRPEIQLERLMARDGIGREAALRKIAAQMPADEKRSYADYLIDTSGALEETLAQAERVYARLAEDAEHLRRRPRKPARPRA